MGKKKKLKGEAVWIDLEQRVYYGKKSSYKSKSGWFANAVASSVRRSIKESLNQNQQSGYSKSHRGYKSKSRWESREPYVPMTIEEMPEELRYLSYPHLRPKPNQSAKPAPKSTATEARKEWTVVDDLRELLRLVRLFFIDLKYGRRRDEPDGIERKVGD